MTPEAAVAVKVERVRFAVAGCQHYEQGYFTAWRKIAEQEFDFVFHYGDLRPGAATILARNPHCKLLNDQRGYCDMEVTREAWRTDFKVLDKVTEPGGVLSTRTRFVVEPGSPKLVAG